MDQNLQEKEKNDRKKKQLLLSSSKYVPYVQKKNTVHGHPVRHKNLISSSARCSFQRRNQKFAPVFHCFVHSGLLLMSAWLPESVSDFSQVGQAVFDGGTSAYTWRLTPWTTRKHPRVLLPPLEKNSNFFVVSLSVAEHFEMCPTNKKAANLFRVFCFICRCRRRNSWFLLWFRVKNGCLYIGNISDLPQITAA